MRDVGGGGALQQDRMHGELLRAAFGAHQQVVGRRGAVDAGARATATRWRSPWLNCEGRWWRRPPSPSASSIATARPAPSPRGMASKTFSSAVKAGKRLNA